ncbi:hypothetical protein [Paraliomyxa miuraensis]|uniref:hypothetical protein n=1 Tax=Paraliomyxa miuraensis TaxID=376150 RepID=UPI0022511F82|nr:hypothetical protein [Paraliomyxa miuraensis]MCX4246772.1 hypothetical protein [Paraliomyxa miuraensis]
MKKLITAVLSLPLLLAGGDSDASTQHFGEYKVKINVTNAEEMKVKWWCKEADGSTSLIDADTYPASTSTTRSTNINSTKCSTGDWKVSFHIKAWGSWKDLEPGSNVCLTNSCGYTTNSFTYKTYAHPEDFTAGSNNKLCTTSLNLQFEKIAVSKGGC